MEYERWPHARARNFMKYLTHRGYTELKWGTYKKNLTQLAEHLSIPFHVFVTMNPITYGKMAFLPQHADTVLKELLGTLTYDELLREIQHENRYLADISIRNTFFAQTLADTADTSMDTEPDPLNSEELAVVRSLLDLTS